MDNFSFTSIWTRVIIYLNGIILILGSLQKTKLANKFLSWEIDLTVIDYLNGEMFIFIVLFSTMFLIVLADYHSIKKDDKINQEFKDVFALTAKGIALSWVILFVLSFLPIIILGDDYVHDSWIKYIVSLGIILGSGVFLLFIGLNIYTIKTIDYSSNFFEPFVNAIRICTIIVITLLAFYSSYLLLHPQTFWGISAMIILGGAISWGIYYILVINTNDNILWILGAAIIFIVTIAVFYNLWNEQKFEKTFINIMLSIIFGLIGMYIFLLLLQTFFIFFKYLYNLKYKKITEPEKHVLQ